MNTIYVYFGNALMLSIRCDYTDGCSLTGDWTKIYWEGNFEHEWEEE